MYWWRFLLSFSRIGFWRRSYEGAFTKYAPYFGYFGPPSTHVSVCSLALPLLLPSEERSKFHGSDSPPLLPGSRLLPSSPRDGSRSFQASDPQPPTLSPPLSNPRSLPNYALRHEASVFIPFVPIFREVRNRRADWGGIERNSEWHLLRTVPNDFNYFISAGCASLELYSTFV